MYSRAETAPDQAFARAALAASFAASSLLLAVAATFDIDPDRLRFSDEQRPLLLAPDAPLIGDGFLTKAGTSVCATGFVYAAGGSAVRADATLFVGGEQRSVTAIGPRTWREISGAGLLVPESVPCSPGATLLSRGWIRSRKSRVGPRTHGWRNR